MSDAKERGDLLTTQGIFGKMRYPVLNAFDLIGREHMRESPFYQEILDEGRAEGEWRTRRTDILEALETRFGAGVVPEFRNVVDTITDAPRLSELLRAAIECRGVGGFRRALRTSQT